MGFNIFNNLLLLSNCITYARPNNSMRKVLVVQFLLLLGVVPCQKNVRHEEEHVNY